MRMTVCLYVTCRSLPWLHEAYKINSKVFCCLRVFTALAQGNIIFLRHGTVRFCNVSGMMLFGPLIALQTSQYNRLFHTEGMTKNPGEVPVLNQVELRFEPQLSSFWKGKNLLWASGSSISALDL